MCSSVLRTDDKVPKCSLVASTSSCGEHIYSLVGPKLAQPQSFMKNKHELCLAMHLFQFFCLLLSVEQKKKY